MYNVTLRHFRVLPCKVISITYSGCVSVALGFQRTKGIRRIVILSVTCLDVQYFTHYLINSTIFRKSFWCAACYIPLYSVCE